MNCNCIYNIEAKLIKHFTPQAGSDVRADCDGIGINFNTGGMSLAMPWTIRGTARGFSSAKGKAASMIASHCPFCGRTTGRHTIGQDDGIEAALAGKQGGA